MHIEIQLPRPGVLALSAAALVGWGMYFTSSSATQATIVEAPPMQVESSSSVAATSSVVTAPAAEPVLSNAVALLPTQPTADADDSTGLTQAEMRIKWTRAEQNYLRQKQDILREQLDGLQKQREELGSGINAVLEEQFRQSVQMLTSLVRDEKKADEFLLTSYRQEWDAEEKAMAAASGKLSGKVTLFWPVEPALGISAYFLDPSYKERFKVEHYAIDIPTDQGTTVLAAAEGVVKDVVDHGLGYNFVTVDHGGYATVYGHLSQFSVRPGTHVRAGDPLGLSGGMPGQPGGGSSTGPHLHFGLYLKGVPVDPLKYLPAYRS